jgi:hypothetical protein
MKRSSRWRLLPTRSSWMTRSDACACTAPSHCLRSASSIPHLPSSIAFALPLHHRSHSHTAAHLKFSSFAIVCPSCAHTHTNHTHTQTAPSQRSFPFLVIQSLSFHCAALMRSIVFAHMRRLAMRLSHPTYGVLVVLAGTTRTERKDSRWRRAREAWGRAGPSVVSL